MTDNRDLIIEARETLRRINLLAGPQDLDHRYRGRVIGRDITEILRDVANALEAATVKTPEQIADEMQQTLPLELNEREMMVAAIKEDRAQRV